MAEENKSYLGFDFSTQRLKAIVVNDDLTVTHECSVQYDTDLPEFRTHGGVDKFHADDSVVTAPTIMWVKALDMILERLKLTGLDFSSIQALSGAAQQHGSVYWKKGADTILSNVQPNKFLHEQLQSCFSIRDSPVWMDSSTASQCKHLEEGVGGPLVLAKITGSRAYERFTGNQIAKIFETKPDAYNNTERISLVSSFAASLFLGHYAAIDLSDGSGMNLLDINEKDWSDECLKLCAPDLRKKLGTPVPSCSVLGTISPYFIERYGFPDDCKIVAFTGDNPASLAGTQLQKGDMAISLGTSDTVFLWLSDPKPSLNGHILCNPLNSSDFMALLCFKNGSLTRERIRDECAENSWQLFNDLLESTPRGNFGNIGMYYDIKEIQPPLSGDYKFNRNNQYVDRFSKEVEVRAVVEGQFLAKRLYAENLGFSTNAASKIIATGGGSTNKALIQVLSDVFNMPVYVLRVPNSACLGAALRAKHGLMGEEFVFHNMFNEPVELCLSATPSKDATSVYGPMLSRYRVLQERVIEALISRGLLAPMKT